MQKVAYHLIYSPFVHQCYSFCCLIISILLFLYKLQVTAVRGVQPTVYITTQMWIELKNYQQRQHAHLLVNLALCPAVYKKLIFITKDCNVHCQLLFQNYKIWYICSQNRGSQSLHFQTIYYPHFINFLGKLLFISGSNDKITMKRAGHIRYLTVCPTHTCTYWYKFSFVLQFYILVCTCGIKPTH